MASDFDPLEDARRVPHANDLVGAQVDDPDGLLATKKVLGGDAEVPAGLNRPRLVKGAGELIQEEVLSWPGVDAVQHRFGGIEYRLGRKEMGHVHGDHLADLPLPRGFMTR